MKTQRTLIAFCTFVLITALHPSEAQGAGYVNVQFNVGVTLFANPLQAADNHLSAIIPTAPEGASVLVWNGALQQYSPAATFNGGAWTGDLLLAPGTGAVMFTPTAFLNTFLGDVLNADGSIYGGTVTPPPPFTGPNGLYLLSNKFPASGGTISGYGLFELIVGRVPTDFDVFYRWNTGLADFSTTTFFAGFWDSGDPFLNVGESGFFDIGGTGTLPTIPEPGSLAIVAVGLLACVIRRRAVQSAPNLT